MATLTATAYVTPMLPTNYAAGLTAQGTTLAAQIDIASGIFIGDIQALYWTPPDVSNTPATPVAVQRTVAILTAHLVHQILGRANEIPDVENPQSQNYLAQYTYKVNQLTGINQPDGRATAVIPRIRITGEAMTFGTAPLDSDQYLFAANVPDGFEVVEGSVQVSGYERGEGRDFLVYFSAENRGWILERIDAGIVDTTTVAYDISFLRARETERADVMSWGKVVRA